MTASSYDGSVVCRNPMEPVKLGEHMGFSLHYTQSLAFIRSSPSQESQPSKRSTYRIDSQDTARQSKASSATQDEAKKPMYADTMSNLIDA